MTLPAVLPGVPPVVVTGENTAEAARQATRAEAAAETAEGFAGDAADAVSAVQRPSTNLLDPDNAGWLTDFRLSPTGGNAGGASGWDTSYFVFLPEGQYRADTFHPSYFAEYSAATGSAYIGRANVTAGVLTVPSGGRYYRGSVQRSGNYARSKMFIIEGTDIPSSVEPFGESYLALSDANEESDAAFADGAIGPAKMATWKKTGNLATGRVDGFYVETDSDVVANSGFAYFDEIRGEPGETFTSNNPLRFVAFVDAGGLRLTSSGLENVTTFTFPAQARGFIASATTSNANTLIINRGATATDDSPPSYTARSELPDGTSLIPATPPGNAIADALDAELGAGWRGGAGVTPDHYGLSRLRETRYRLRRLRYLGAGNGVESRLNIPLVGDSWTHDAGRFARDFARSLWSKYHPSGGNTGPIGTGWISFRGLAGGTFPNGTVWWNNFMEAGGAWTSVNSTDVGPDTGSTTSSQSGDYIQTASGFDYGKGCAYRLFAEGGAGVVRYRWTSAGSWTTLDLSALAAGLQVIPLTGQPASGVNTFRIEVVSGTVKLYGMTEEHPTSGGVIVHKLGATGSRLQQWATLGGDWETGFAALNPHLTVITHGTNDQGAGRTKAQFKADLITLIDRVRSAKPRTDILLVAPAENQRENSVPMSDYAEAMYEVARDDRDVAYWNLQNGFGPASDPSQYASGGIRPLFAADGIHPNSATGGGYPIVDDLLEAIGELSA